MQYAHCASPNSPPIIPELCFILSQAYYAEIIPGIISSCLVQWLMSCPCTSVQQELVSLCTNVASRQCCKLLLHFKTGEANIHIYNLTIYIYCRITACHYVTVCMSVVAKMRKAMTPPSGLPQFHCLCLMLHSLQLLSLYSVHTLEVPIAIHAYFQDNSSCLE